MRLNYYGGHLVNAAVGIAAGMGREASALLGTTLALVVPSLFPRIVPKTSVAQKDDRE